MKEVPKTYEIIMKNKLTQKILQTIKHARILKGISQEYLAHQLKISQNSYHKIEAGKTDLKVITLMKIAEILDINYIDLFTSKKHKNIA